jgi:hypothetical protein
MQSNKLDNYGVLQLTVTPPPNTHTTKKAIVFVFNWGGVWSKYTTTVQKKQQQHKKKFNFLTPFYCEKIYNLNMIKLEKKLSKLTKIKYNIK